MKKVLLFLGIFAMSLAFIACDSESLSSFDDEVTEIQADIADLVTRVDNLDTTIAALEDMTDDITDDITGIDSDITDIMADISSIQTSIQTITADILEVEGDIADLQTQVTANEDNIAAHLIEINLLIADMADLNADLVALDAAFQAYVESQDLMDSWDSMLTTEVVIMYNNDVHGRVNDDSWNQSIGYAKIKNVVDEIRGFYDYTYFVSAGDMFHGTTFATLEEGESFVEVMNAVGYDLMVPGNHDFDYGQDQLLVLESMANFPIISSNIEYGVGHPSYDATPEADNSMFDMTYIETFGDVTVGFFGLTTPDTTYMTHPDNVIDLLFLDPVNQAQAMVEYLEGEDVDLIICLSHIGLDEADSVTSADIANSVDGIDIIVDGHSHTYLPQGLTVNDTLIISTGEYNKNLGVLKLVVEDGEIIHYNNKLINFTEVDALGYGADKDVQAIIDAIEADQEVILSVVVGQTAVILDGERDDVRTSETNLGRIITDQMLVVTGADIAITNGGGIRASIDAGDVTRGDVITVLPFGNIIVTINLTGQQIIDSLEYGTSGLPDSSGKMPHVAGITFTVDLNQPDGSRVSNVLVGGVAIDPAAIYSVATNDFLAAGGDGYVLFAATPVTAEFMGLHEALEAAFTLGVDIVIPSDVRITIIPEVI